MCLKENRHHLLWGRARKLRAFQNKSGNKTSIKTMEKGIRVYQKTGADCRLLPTQYTCWLPTVTYSIHVLTADCYLLNTRADCRLLPTQYTCRLPNFTYSIHVLTADCYLLNTRADCRTLPTQYTCRLPTVTYSIHVSCSCVIFHVF